MKELTKRDFIDHQLQARLGRLTIEARGFMEGGFTGRHKSPHRGSSVEFSQYRKYVQGDDIRNIDWRVYGRTERHYVKEFEADTSLRSYMVIDCSASMAFESKDGSKFNFARTMVATLSHILVQQGDAVGLYAFNDKLIHELPPRTSPKHLYAINETLGTLKPSGSTNIIDTLHNLATKIRRRAMVIIFSDFFTDVERLIDSFSHLHYKKHDVVVFHIVDDAEVKFEFTHPMRFMDMEGNDSLIADPAIIRSEYLQHLNDYLKNIRIECLKHKVDYRFCIPSEGVEGVLRDFLLERIKGGH